MERAVLLTTRNNMFPVKDSKVMVLEVGKEGVADVATESQVEAAADAPLEHGFELENGVRVHLAGPRSEREMLERLSVAIHRLLMAEARGIK